ncbi:protein-L-isoaspartate O-methyltransferase family protein [Oleisolibacter albus]|uniref:protein-L-isoaspartate O-methyltransferase family protein n=1 Tax=Oleisolibacter albus TaxID=2171757 RepID=UPI000DF3D01E|nr:protein-L-isoaspartate O-methyltransferase [Oleisolibacter albus]
MMAPTDFTAARTNMVEGQIRPNRVTDARLIDAFQSVPREQFVPKALRGVAYVDEDIHIGHGRYLLEPRVLARLLQEAQVTADDVVLDVGSGMGYSAAVIGRLAATVVALESEPDLAAQATAAFQANGVDNALIMQGPLAAGWAKQAPYNVIVLEGAVTEVPQVLLDQLAEGGRLVCVLGGDAQVGTARLFQKLDGVVSGRTLFDATVRALPGFERAPAFQF